MARKSKTEMTVEMRKFVDDALLKEMGVKDEHIVANEKGDNVARMDATASNIALLLTASDTKDVTIKMGLIVEAINWPAGTRGYFNTLKFVLPKGTKIGPHIVLEEEKVLEFLHYTTSDDYGKSRRVYTRIRDDDVTKETMDSVHNVLFPPTDLTGKPIPETDYCSRLVSEFGWNEEKLEHAAEMIKKYGMSWRAYYLAEQNKAKVKK